MFDRYALAARVTPAIIVLLPVIVAVALWTGGDWPKTLIAVVSWGGLSYFAGQIARDQGTRRERELWALWHGRPTTRFLRHADSTIPKPAQRRYHAKLRELVPGVTMPTVNDEKESPAAADETYESCVMYLLEQTRDAKRFSLLLSENIAYGFRRNLWGMKAAAIVILVLSIAASAAKLLFYDLSEPIRQIVVLDIVAILFLALLFAVWVVRVSPNWIMKAADAYAVRLLSCCDVLEPQSSAPRA